MVSCCFGLLGYLRQIWRAIGIVLAFAVSYALSVWAAAGVDLNSPFLSDEERGKASGQALCVGGLVGTFCILCVVSFLLSSGLSWKKFVVVAPSRHANLAFTGAYKTPPHEMQLEHIIRLCETVTCRA
jgi:hypothetical protein